MISNVFVEEIRQTFEFILFHPIDGFTTVLKSVCCSGKVISCAIFLFLFVNHSNCVLHRIELSILVGDG